MEKEKSATSYRTKVKRKYLTNGHATHHFTLRISIYHVDKKRVEGCAF